MKIVLLASIISLLTIYTYGQTSIIGGDVSGNWNKVDGPFLIKGDIRIPNEEILVIEAGTVIKFDGSYSITVEGAIEAIGKSTDLIHFTTTAENTEAGWNRIFYYSTLSTNDSSVFKYCLFENAKVYNKIFGSFELASVFEIYDFSKISISNCIFQNNYSHADNWSTPAGVIVCKKANVLIIDCLFKNNFSRSKGGAISIRESEKSQIVRNRFIGNISKEGGGGAIYVQNSDVDIINNLFAFNSIPVDYSGHTSGGAISSQFSSKLKVINNTFYNNIAEQGGALFINENLNTDTIINNIFIGNKSHYTMQGHDISLNKANVYMSNCNIDLAPKNIDIYASDLQLGVNIYDSLCLSNPENEIFDLNPMSLCINAGENTILTASSDLNGNPRIYNDGYNIIDIGAYEFQAMPSPVYNVVLQRDIIDYKYLTVNSEISDSIVLTNTNLGDASVTIKANEKILVDDNTHDFNFVLKSYSDTTLYFRFVPSKLGNDTDNLVIVNESADTELNIKLKYIGTNHSVLRGLVVNNTHNWTHDTIIVKDHIVVESSGILNISKNTVLYFEGGKGINVYGSFNISEDSQNQVLFSVADAYKDSGWNGINFYGDGSKQQSVMRFATIEYASWNPKYKKGGSAIYVNNYDSLNISNCVIRYNQASSQDIIKVVNQSNILLYSNLIHNNNIFSCSNTMHLAESKVKLINNTICDNYNPENCPSIFANATIYIPDINFNDVVFANNILYNNGFSNKSNPIEMRGWNSIADGTLEIINSMFDYEIDTVTEHSRFFSFEYINRVFGDPKFLNQDMQDYRIRPDSECIDNGFDISDLNIEHADLLGNERVFGSAIDIGAYEYQGNYAPGMKKPIEDILIDEGFVEVQYDMDEYFIDYEGDEIFFEIDQFEASIVDASIGDRVLVIRENNIGKTDIVIKARDEKEDSTLVSFNFDINFIPKIKNHIEDTTLTHGDTLLIDLNDVFYDIDDDTLSYYFSTDGWYYYVALQKDTLMIIPSKWAEESLELSIRAVDRNKAECIESFVVYLGTNSAELLKIQEFNIFPNPAKDELILNIDTQHPDLSYIIYDNYGRILKTDIYNFSHIDISGLKQGMYYLKLYNKSKSLGLVNFIKM